MKAPSRRIGFTLIELLVVIAIIAILAAILLPVFAKARSKAQGIYCLHNMKELGLSWLLYADDYGGKLAPNGNGGNGMVINGVVVNTAGWVRGWLDWTTGSDNTNQVFLKNSLFGPYTKGQVDIYKCPADNYVNQSQRSRGWGYRVRSCSMNGFIEGGIYSDPGGGSNWYSDYLPYNKLSDITRPTPTELWVMLDEHPDSINDGWMITNPDDLSVFEDWPASHHNGACSFNFADGHSEIHKWLEPSTRKPIQYIWLNGTSVGSARRDTTWMRDHSSAKRRL